MANKQQQQHNVAAFLCVACESWRAQKWNQSQRWQQHSSACVCWFALEWALMNETKCANQNGKVLKSIYEINTYHFATCIRYVAKLVLVSVRAYLCLKIRDVISIECGPHLPPPQSDANWCGFLLFDRFMRKLALSLARTYLRSLSILNMQDMRHWDSCTAKYHHVKYLVFRSHTLPLGTYVFVCLCARVHVYCTHWTRKNMKIKISYHKTISAHSLAAYSTNGKIMTRCFAEYICRLCSHIFYWTSCYYCLLPSPLLRLRLILLAIPSEHQTSNNTMVEVTPG